jgi:hypothetical protein
MFDISVTLLLKEFALRHGPTGDAILLLLTVRPKCTCLPEPNFAYHLLLLLLLVLPFVLGPLASFPSELIWNYGSYKQLIGLLGRGISPIAMPLPTQNNMKTEETRLDIHTSSEIRTHGPSV